MADLIKNDPVLNGSEKDYLFHYVRFYQQLSNPGKKRFLKRVKKFISNKDFEFFLDPQNDHLLIKVLIAASCIQLTWGLDDKYLDMYTYIGVHRNGIQLKKDKTKPLNALWLQSKNKESWNHVQDGHFFMGVGGRQIGLMEWSSVFIIEAKKDNILDDFFSAYYKVWCEAARDIMFVVDEEDQLPLDTFGRRLPLIIQYFFDDPAELQANHPEMYEHTKKLLNLDLLEAKEYDFIYADKIKVEKGINSKNRALILNVQDQVRKFSLPAGIMYAILVQIPVVIALWFITGRWTYFSWTFIGLFLAFSALGSLIVYRSYYIKRGLSKYASLILFVIGLMPCIYSSMNLLNYLIPLEQKSHIIKVDKLIQVEKHLPWYGFTTPHIVKVTKTQKKYTLNEKTGKYETTNEIVAIYVDQNHIKSATSLFDENDIVEMHTYKGLFGAEVLYGFELTLIQ